MAHPRPTRSEHPAAGLRSAGRGRPLVLPDGSEPEEDIVLVLVENSTPEPDGSYRRYALRVPPDQTVPRDAIGWTFGLPPDTYAPDAMT
ncbi:DUF6745 domain-containing protein [Streptomyces broussonetiae]|uniref:DUF6745 domain-containing protein n=1 Tax=Streptomyces broussonetiae TaxID=2686304 RepID=UPI0035E39C32